MRPTCRWQRKRRPWCGPPLVVEAKESNYQITKSRAIANGDKKTGDGLKIEEDTPADAEINYPRAVRVGDEGSRRPVGRLQCTYEGVAVRLSIGILKIQQALKLEPVRQTPVRLVAGPRSMN